MSDTVQSWAAISDDSMYRYLLGRIWGDGNLLGWVMLNPSTADGTVDDATIRRCVDYAKRWGFGGILVANLFNFRATDPKVMRAAPDPIGPDWAKWLEAFWLRSSQVVVAWGSSCRWRAQPHRDRDVLAHLRSLRPLGVPILCLKKSKHGFPVHPVRQRADLQPIEYGDAP